MVGSGRLWRAWNSRQVTQTLLEDTGELLEVFRRKAWCDGDCWEKSGGRIGGVAWDSPGVVGDRFKGSSVRHVGLKPERARWAGEKGIRKVGHGVSTQKVSFPSLPCGSRWRLPGVCSTGFTSWSSVLWAIRIYFAPYRKMHFFLPEISLVC